MRATSTRPRQRGSAGGSYRRTHKPAAGRLRMPARPSSNAVSLAGEFLTLAELHLRGFVGTLTLGNAKAIDILALNPVTRRTFKVETKTTGKSIRNERAFGRNYGWMMSEVHGRLTDPDLVYCFVHLGDTVGGERRSRFFLVPSADVAAYVRWEYAHVERHRERYGRRRLGKQREGRMFRIPAGEPRNPIVPPTWRDGRWRRYEGSWQIFGRPP